MENNIKVRAGITIHASDGMTGKNEPDRMSTEGFYFAEKGTKIKLLDKVYFFNVATYSLDFPEEYMHTYVYAPDEAWVSYNHDLSKDTYQQNEYLFSEQVYFRICLKRADGKDFTLDDEKNINKIISCKVSALNKTPLFFKDEADDTTEKIKELQTPDSLTFALITDTHCTLNGTWQDTIANLLAVNEKVDFDAIIHLGDLTDGITSREMTKKYVKNILHDLEKIDAPLHIVLGNHDSNYFMNNTDIFSIDEQVDLYQEQSEKYKSDKKKPYYYTDMPDKKMRCIFLSAYDNNEKFRYGFDLAQINWLQKALASLPNDYFILIFAHDAPLAKLDYWADEIRNGNVLVQILEKYQRKHNNILAYIHGHTHADSVYSDLSFPVISIGCAKCEDMQDKKPLNSLTPKREKGKVSQELWDTLVVHPKSGDLHFVRFGAGDDRNINRG